MWAVPNVTQCHTSGHCESPELGRRCCTIAGAIISPHHPGAMGKAWHALQLQGCSLPRPGLPWDSPDTFCAVLNKGGSFKLKWKWLVGFRGCFLLKTVFII